MTGFTHCKQICLGWRLRCKALRVKERLGLVWKLWVLKKLKPEKMIRGISRDQKWARIDPLGHIWLRSTIWCHLEFWPPGQNCWRWWIIWDGVLLVLLLVSNHTPPEVLDYQACCCHVHSLKSKWGKRISILEAICLFLMKFLENKKAFLEFLTHPKKCTTSKKMFPRTPESKLNWNGGSKETGSWNFDHMDQSGPKINLDWSLALLCKKSAIQG